MLQTLPTPTTDPPLPLPNRIPFIQGDFHRYIQRGTLSKRKLQISNRPPLAEGPVHTHAWPHAMKHEARVLLRGMGRSVRGQSGMPE